MRNLFTKLMFGVIILLSFLMTKTFAQSTELSNDSLIILRKVATFKVATTNTYKTEGKSTIFESKIFSSINPKFKDLAETRILVQKDTALVSVYELKQYVNAGTFEVDTIFDLLGRDPLRLALNQSDILQFFSFKENKKWFKENKNGSVFFIFKSNPPEESKIFVSYYFQFGIAKVNLNRRGDLIIDYIPPVSGKKIDSKEKNRFVVLN